MSNSSSSMTSTLGTGASSEVQGVLTLTSSFASPSRDQESVYDDAAELAVEDTEEPSGSIPGLTGDSCPVWRTEVEPCPTQVGIDGEGERRRAGLAYKPSSEDMLWESDQMKSPSCEGIGRGVDRAMFRGVITHTRGY